MAKVHFGTHTFEADLVIFDKDGTLIDFAELWATYTTRMVEALVKESIEGRTGSTAITNPPIEEHLRAELYASLGYDPTARRFDSQSPVLTAPLPILYTLAAGVLYRHGWGWLAAELQVEHAFSPIVNEPLAREMVRPTAELPLLFGALRNAGVQIGVVTSDDRAPTVTTLTWLGVLDQVAFIACANDAYPFKPAPDAIWAACQELGVDLARTVMVGDSTTDMMMGERAGVGLRVAVLTGLMDATILTPHAHVVLDSIGDILVANIEVAGS